MAKLVKIKIIENIISKSDSLKLPKNKLNITLFKLLSKIKDKIIYKELTLDTISKVPKKEIKYIGKEFFLENSVNVLKDLYILFKSLKKCIIKLKKVVSILFHY